MSLAEGLLIGALFLGFVYWITTGALGLRALLTMPVLADLRPAEPPRWPTLSLIIPACNEEASLEPAVTSRCEQGYPGLEIVVVEDRSTDRTPAIVDRLAAADPRVKAIHVTQLPDGWLGKLHALHRGAEAATGEWLLFSDADVHFAPETLKRAVAYCEQRGLDFLTVMPQFNPKSFLIDVAVSWFVRIVVGAAQTSAVEDPASRVAVGGGVFNLVRRSSFDKTPGFQWLKLEIADDVGLGQMVKRSGARCSVVNARGFVTLYFYESLADMARGCEKAGLSLMGRFSQIRLVVTAVVFLALELSPLAAVVLPHGIPWLRAAGATVLAFSLVSSAIINRGFGRPAWTAFFAPMGAVIMAAFFLRSGYMAWKKGGVMWRGTLYSTALLKSGARYKAPWEGP